MIKQPIRTITLILSLLFLEFAATANPVLAERTAAPTPRVNALGCGNNTVSLISPANDATLPALYSEFTFHPIIGISDYSLIVSTTSDFSSMDDTLGEQGYEFTIPNLYGGDYTFDSSVVRNFLPDTIYYWHVAPQCGGIDGVYSATFHFKTPKEGILLPAPVLKQPLNDVTAATNGVTFTWDEVSGATSYQIRFYRYDYAAAFADTPVRTYYDGAIYDIHHRYQYISDLPFATIFYWRVAAVNSYAVGALSEVRKITIPVKEGTALINSSGGVVSTDGGAITVWVDQDAVQSPTTFNISLNPHPSTKPPFRFANRSFSITATRESDGSPITQFDSNHQLHFYLTYTDEDLEASKIPGGGMNLELMYYDGSSWQQATVCFIDTDLHLVRCDLDHLTEFALGAPIKIFLPTLMR